MAHWCAWAWPLLGLAPFSDANPLMMARRIVEADFAPIDDGRYSDRLKVHCSLCTAHWTAAAVLLKCRPTLQDWIGC